MSRLDLDYMQAEIDALRQHNDELRERLGEWRECAEGLAGSLKFIAEWGGKIHQTEMGDISCNGGWCAEQAQWATAEFERLKNKFAGVTEGGNSFLSPSDLSPCNNLSGGGERLNPRIPGSEPGAVRREPRSVDEGREAEAPHDSRGRVRPAQALETVAFLRKFNLWRRGGYDQQPPRAHEVGEAIDSACDHIERMEREIDGLRDQLCADKCRDKAAADGGWANI